MTEPQQTIPARVNRKAIQELRDNLRAINGNYQHVNSWRFYEPDVASRVLMELRHDLTEALAIVRKLEAEL